MGRIAWSQLRVRLARSVSLLLGMLLAATAFTVLTAASRTSQLRTVGTVSAHFRPAYDILVRPSGGRTALETRTRTVQPDFLSGSDGGISMAQYRQIQQLPGVQLAAPIAIVGYALLRIFIPVLLPAAANAGPGRQLYRYRITWVSAAGTSRVAQPPSYLYLTPRRLRATSAGGLDEELAGGRTAAVCPPTGAVSNPFGLAAQAVPWCWSQLNGTAGTFVSGEPAHRAFATVDWSFPMLIAAVDPAAEARMDGLSSAVVSGRYLPAGQPKPGAGPLAFPVLASATSGIGEYALTQIQRLPPPAAPPDLRTSWLARAAGLAGPVVRTVRISAQQAYQQVLAALRQGEIVHESWTAGPVRYRAAPGGALTPVPVRNPPSVWRAPEEQVQLLAPPMDETDAQYRKLTVHGVSTEPGPAVRPSLVGVFDPAKIRQFDPLSQVPLGPYQPVTAAPADAASRAALGGDDLLPSLNLGGLVSQPVQLVTTLAALPGLESSGVFGGQAQAARPISAIRVRVAGVTGPDPVSLERIREVAQQIALRTGLDVDIVAGSSPAPVTIGLPAGRFGQPALRLSERWTKLGVAVAILSAVDRQSVLLFALILLVCVLFVANSATAAVRSRRAELALLACVGWTRPRLFALVLGELAAMGLAAGALSAAAALPLSAALRLHASAARALLAIPVAVAVAMLAGAGPAWLAAHSAPVVSLRQPAVAVRRGHRVGGITGLAVLNVARTPGRTLTGALALAAGVAGLTVLTAVTFAFRGVVVGSLLGDAVAVQVRGVDYVAVAATVALGVLAVADVVFLNVSERAGELAVIRSFGWREAALSRLVLTEGTLIGVAGSVAGAAAGLAAAAAFAGQLPSRSVLAAVAGAAAGILVTAAAALVPAWLLRRLPAAELLAQE